MLDTKTIKSSIWNILFRYIRFFVNHKVFISVAEKDLHYADRIRKYLESYGASVFHYKESIKGGDSWRNEIKKNLNNSDFYICLISNEALNSDNVKLELGGAYFESRKRKILPVLLEEVDKRHLGMVDEIQYVYYNNKNFYPSLKNHMLKIFLYRAIFWIVFGLILILIK